MKRIVLVLFCLLAFPVVASHIVGGEFEILYVSGSNYKVNLILYFDRLNGDPGARDLVVVARIFRKKDNFVMTNVVLNLTNEQLVSYTQPACSEGEIVTSKLIYTTQIQMPATQYNDPEGYYIAWERCCRNYTITNIFSDDPTGGGQYAGQTFYLEFPPVVKDGVPFIDSTPRLFPPLNDYACPGRPYYVDFAGTDDDGDSLVYSLVAPLNTKSADALPPGNVPRPRPYPTVKWREPFGPNNILGGNPDLKISDEGFLTVTPQVTGLFVFAVKCEEFRDGVKIGEVRRDFQMLVIPCKDVAVPPQITGRTATEPDFTHDQNMVVTFDNTVSDEDRCVQVKVSDEDVFNALDDFTENVHIRAVALNFKKDISDVLPEITNATLTQTNDSQIFNICFDRCPPFEGGAYQIGIVAYDDACALPLTDTLKILVNVEPPLNQKPEFITPDVVELSAQEGDSFLWDIEGIDADGDWLTIGFLNDGFSLANVGMTLNEVAHDSGSYKAQLVWDTRCDVYDFTQKSNFLLKVLIDDADECNFPKWDTMTFNLAVKLPVNDYPVISTDLSPEELQNGVTRKIFEPLGFHVFGTDKDDDFLVLEGTGVGFKFDDLAMSFPGDEGKSSVASLFDWNITCDNVNLALQDQFELQFMVVDSQNKCGFYKASTLNVKVNVEPPDNQPPDLVVVNTNPDLPFEDNEQSLMIGDQVSLGLIANDPDNTPAPDEIRIDLVEASGNNTDPVGYNFAPAIGVGSAETTFTWNPECSIFQNGVYENDYTFRFVTRDNRCFNNKTDTVAVHITVRDKDSKVSAFIPPNVVTPNGDARNDFFAMVRQNPATQELESILPIDNCVGHFISIVIYNRWGTEVFASEDRNFRWYPDKEAAGVYFYTLKYSDKEYKGSISLRN